MRTSATQFQLLVEYMERNGDLSKPTEGPQGRVFNHQRWAELTQLLNADATGDTKTSEKWRKVWSDLKNNTKKKGARIHRAALGTGGGPASTSKLSDLEERILSLVGTKAATGFLHIPEVGLEVEETDPPHEKNDSPSILLLQPLREPGSAMESWNRPGPSTRRPLFPPLCTTDSGEVCLVSGGATESTNPEVIITAQETEPHAVDRSETDRPGNCGVRPASRSPPLPATSARSHAPQSPTPLPLTPRRRRRGRLVQEESPIRRRTRTQTQSDLARQAFVRSDCEWRAFQQETERERNRLRELELKAQERWLDLIGEFLSLGNRIVDVLENKL